MSYHGKAYATEIMKKSKKIYLKILSIKDANIISCSEDKYEIGKQLLAGKVRDELYESTLIFGQTLHYIPNVTFPEIMMKL